MATRFIRVVAALIRDQRGRLLICQRSRHKPMPLKWEFPGGKIEATETPRRALARELREELAITPVIGRRLATVRHTYGDGTHVQLFFYGVQEWKGTITNLVFEDVRWVPARQLPKFDFLEADLEVIRRLAAAKSRPTFGST
jgi:8-oxo-dGTP diphosphatase